MMKNFSCLSYSGQMVLKKNGKKDRKLNPSFIRIAKWMAVWLFMIFLSGCVAQQADVVRIKRELDSKINQLDKSKTALQEAVGEANKALENANLIIAKQRGEIKELLHARAELMDQVSNLRETDLSQVRGAIENNQHQMSELTKRFGDLENDFQSVRNQAQQTQASLEPLVSQLGERVVAEEQLLTEQGGKLGEFRNSLVDYQQTLTAIRENLAKHDQKVNSLEAQFNRLAQNQEVKENQIQANFEEVRQSIQSVITTMEKVGTTLGNRLDGQDRKLNRLTGLKKETNELSPLSAGNLDLSGQFRDAKPPVISQSIQVSPSLNQKGSSRNVAMRAGTHQGAGPSSSVGVFAVPGFSVASTRNPQELQDPRKQYETAFNLLRQGQYVGAAAEFSTFLRTFHDSPLASNAQYWLGECYYGQRRFAEAIDEFERVFMLYPESPKVPASLLKIGYSHLELEDPATARSVFQQLVRTYPKSPEALKAYSRLQEVDSLPRKPS